LATQAVETHPLPLNRRFCPSETAKVLFHIDRYLVRWALRKYKHLRRAGEHPDEQAGPWPTSSVLGQASSRTGDGRPCNERLQHEPDDRSPVS